jgi:hypothetical protein
MRGYNLCKLTLAAAVLLTVDSAASFAAEKSQLCTQGAALEP